MGFLSASSRIDVVLPGKDDALEEACHIINDHGGRIINISVTQLKQNQMVHLFRLEKMDLEPIVDDLTKAGHNVLSSMN
jgi:hypothetical protein